MKPNRSLFRSTTAALLVTLALGGCGQNIPPTIKIGVAQPLSGSSAARGKDVLDGVKLAVDEINASGYKIAGKPVQFEVVAMDDKADKEEAKKVAQALVDQKVTVVIGHLSSDVTEAVIPIYKAANLPQLFTSSAAELTSLGDGNAFRIVANDVLQARAIASYLAETLKVKKIAVLHEDSAFGTPMAKDVAAALARLDRKVESVEAVSSKSLEFAAYVDKLKASRPDALVAAVRDHQLLPLMTAMKAAGLGDVVIMATSVAKTQKMVSSPADVKALYLTSGSIDPREFTPGAAFVSRFRAAYKSDPVWAAHYAYDAMFVLADVMRRADSLEPAALRAKLASIDTNAPVTGMMRFGTDGEQKYGAIGVYEKRNGQWEPLIRSDRW